MTNYSKICCGMYIVRTRAGFKQAIKDYMSDDWCYKPLVHGHPVTYPSLISLTVGYNGANYIQCRAIHVNKLSSALEGQ